MSQSMLVELKMIEGETAVSASADVTFQTEFGELTLSRLKVIHQDGKEPWVALPDIRYKDTQSGEFKNLKVIIPGARLKKAISDAVLTKYAELGVESR